MAISYNAIGILWLRAGSYEAARNYFAQAAEILLPDSPELIIVCSNLGMVSCYLKEYDNALRYYKAVLEIRQKNLPPGHPDIAIVNINIADLYLAMDRLDDALHHCEQVLVNCAATLPTWHPSIVHTRMVVGIIYHAKGDNEKAVVTAAEFIDQIPEIYRNLMSIYNEEYRRYRLRAMMGNLHILNSIAYSNPGNLGTSDLYNVMLHTKDIGKESDLVIREINIQTLDPRYAGIVGLLKEKQHRRDFLLNSGGGKDELETLNSEIQNIELSLPPCRKYIDFKNHMARMTTENVLGNLPIDHALIEFGWFYYTKPAADTRAEIKSGGRYYAYLLRDGEITLEYLEAGEEIIHEKLNEVRKKIAPDDSRNILSSDPSNANNELSELYQLLIAPFEDKLHGIRHLYIAPDGELYKLPFELLLDGSGEALSSDKRSVSYLSSGRDLVRPEWIQPVAGYKSAAILADPQFDVDNQKTTNDEDADIRRDIVSRQSRDLRKLKKFAPIPFAKVEANAIERVFDEIESKTKKVKLEARNDTLSEISSTGSPNIIHIATHGFALEKQELPEDELILQLQGELTRSLVEDPLLRSGLAFAGANTWLQSDRKKQQGIYGTGILFAKTVLSLDLRETDLLVLSACQTALGEVRNGEGIQGLRRAFELSGVRTLICTLWSVQDDACAILMERFYKNLLKNDMNKLLALRNAQEYVKEMDMSELIDYYKQAAPEYAKTLEETYDTPQLMAERPFEHPYYWAGYILQGDTGRPNNR